MKKFFYSLIIILVVLFASWFVYNKFIYHIPVADIPDSYFTYTGDIYTGTRENNGFYRMIDYFNDPQNEQLFSSGFRDFDYIKIWTGTNLREKSDGSDGYDIFHELYLTGRIGTGEVYVQKLDRIENAINYVLYTGLNLYDKLYGSLGQGSGYDQFVKDIEIINNLSWQYEKQDIENYDFRQDNFGSSLRGLLNISVLSCYLKDYDRCYNYRSQAYQLSRNTLYAKGPVFPSYSSTLAYGFTLKVADFLVENNMVDDRIHQKILAQLDSGNLYNADQLLHNIKVSEYNYFKYIIYNMEEADRRLGRTVLSHYSNYDSYSFKTKLFFNKDITHVWLKNMLKYDYGIQEYIGYNYDGDDIFNFLMHILRINPRFNNYGIALLSTMPRDRGRGPYDLINQRLSYRHTIIKKYKEYTPIVRRGEIKSRAVVDLSGSQDISGVVGDNNTLTGSDSKKDFAYCQQFKNKISVYIKCIKSIE